MTLFGAHVQKQSFLVIGVAAAVFALLALFFGRTYAGKALTRARPTRTRRAPWASTR